jgi:hypothetical protein
VRLRGFCEFTMISLAGTVSHTANLAQVRRENATGTPSRTRIIKIWLAILAT